MTGRSDQKKAVGPKKGRSDQIFRSEKNQRAQAHIGIPRHTVTQFEDKSPERSERTESEQEEGTEDAEEREPAIL